MTLVIANIAQPGNIYLFALIRNKDKGETYQVHVFRLLLKRANQYMACYITFQPIIMQ